jgi:hypothetical protein
VSTVYASLPLKLANHFSPKFEKEMDPPIREMTSKPSGGVRQFVYLSYKQLPTGANMRNSVTSGINCGFGVHP